MRELNAFSVGVQYSNPKARVDVVFCNSWSAPEKAPHATEWLYRRGNDVFAAHVNDIATMNGGVGGTVLKYENAVLLGHYSDLRRWMGDSVLSSSFFDFQPVFKLFADATAGDTFANLSRGKVFMGMDTGVSQLAPLSQQVAPETARMVEAAKRGILNGTLKVFCGDFTDTTGLNHSPDGSDGCYSEDYIVSDMNWMHGGCTDLGAAILPHEACSPGTWHSFDDLTGLYACTNCTSGAFAGTTLLGQCLPCPAGLGAGGEGAAWCLPCPAGSNSQLGQVCITCPEDHVAPKPGWGTCDPCPTGLKSSGGIVCEAEEVDTTLVLVVSLCLAVFCVPAAIFLLRRRSKEIGKIFDAILSEAVVLIVFLCMDLGDIVTDVLTCLNVTQQEKLAHLRAPYIFFTVVGCLVGFLVLVQKAKTTRGIFTAQYMVTPACDNANYDSLNDSLSLTPAERLSNCVENVARDHGHALPAINRKIQSGVLAVVVLLFEGLPMLILNLMCVQAFLSDGSDLGSDSSLILTSLALSGILCGYKIGLIVSIKGELKQRSSIETQQEIVTASRVLISSLVEQCGDVKTPPALPPTQPPTTNPTK
jgi:hypothetical protein